ncbi:TIGR01459 family HAD-type hydrolase [Yoonia sp.]|uniref:TIGR01459 family HAD-type hydrolase n=1 Tax=Yoonia sp. TaxID=2212373 RepID=UPI002FD94014
MVVEIDNLGDIADRFDVIVLDQWGVLHDGSAPYPGAVDALARLKSRGKQLAVLSNSGKRAASNLGRIADLGFDPAHFDHVMTSGEALWQDIAAGRVTARRAYALERAPGDATAWAEGLDFSILPGLDDADAVLLMGLPDGAVAAGFDLLLGEIIARDLPILCTNPDRASPRAGGVTVISPGALAHAAAAAGATVIFYGKPHAPIFRALEASLGITSERLLMVGDSLEHDIAGACAAGWSTAFVRGGLHAAAFAGDVPMQEALAQLATTDNAPLPDFTLATLGGRDDPPR